MIIRKANMTEANMLLNMMTRIMSESSMGFLKDADEAILNIYASLLNRGSYYLIALDENKLAGWVLLGPDNTPLYKGKTGCISSLYVFRPYRRLGVGKMLMKKALSDLKHQNYNKVLLNVYHGNPAKSLYTQLGFQDVSHVMELNFSS